MKVKILLATLFLAVLPFSVLDAQQILDVRTVVDLNKDGSGKVTQTWNVNVVSGTEFYIPVTNLKKMSISDFSVAENGAVYENEGRHWNIDRSIDEKAGRCGIVEKGDGVELCWGEGSYGNHVWVCSYTVHGLVQSFSDYDGFNYQFINQDMMSEAQSIEITIRNAADSTTWTTDNTRIWGFGFDGSINVEDGMIVAMSSGRVQYANVMARFNKGIFSPEVSRDMSFGDLREKAFEGSDYKDYGFDWGGFLIFALVILGFVFFLAALIYSMIAYKLGYKYKKKLYGTTKIDEWYRDLPLDGNLAAAWYTYKNGFRFFNESQPDDLIGAYFLRWILSGAVRVQKDPLKPKKTALVFTDVVPQFEDDQEKELYEMAIEASGDRILESSEFKNWSRRHYQKMVEWPDQVNDEGMSYLFEKKYIGGFGDGMSEHQEDLRHLIGFKNFLNDFTLSTEREADDVKLWKNWLVYAQLFGIADKVAKQFKNLYPEILEKEATALGMESGDLINVIYWNQRMTTSGYSNAVSRQQAVASSRHASGGLGGGTSFGGGGGFSGGGFGGGSR